VRQSGGGRNPGKGERVGGGFHRLVVGGDPVNAEEVAPKGARVVVVAAPKRGSQSATVNQRERADVVGVEHDADSAPN